MQCSFGAKMFVTSPGYRSELPRHIGGRIVFSASDSVKKKDWSVGNIKYCYFLLAVFLVKSDFFSSLFLRIMHMFKVEEWIRPKYINIKNTIEFRCPNNIWNESTDSIDISWLTRRKEDWPVHRMVVGALKEYWKVNWFVFIYFFKHSLIK